MFTHSIVILTRDRPALLPRAVASALGALDDGGEILIVDDASAVPAGTLPDLPRSKALRILRREVSQGVSAARNAGIAASRGAVIFFLDDDDELAPDYVKTVLDGPALRFDYGFSACRVVDGAGRAQPVRPRFATGPVPPGAPMRKQICGTGMGFWIRREVAEANGPFDTELPINEDTDYLCRLIQGGRRAWYSARPGVTIHKHSGPGDLSNVTSRTGAVDRARAMLRVCERFPAMTPHLGRSYLRHCARAGLSGEGTGFIRRQPDRSLRLVLALYYHSKRLGYRLRQSDLRGS